MGGFKVKLVESGQYASKMDGGGYMAGENEDFVWESRDEAEKVVEVCEKYWGKMKIVKAA